MNLVHRWICSSALWKRTVQNQIFPWALAGVDLGANVLEVGPGPGITTDILRTRVNRLTCVEIDPELAKSLDHRMAGTNVTVMCQDATELPIPDASFDGAVSFTMMHHIPSPALQDRMFREVARVLRPGGTFAGTDSTYSRIFALLHLFDTMVLVDPQTLPDRLRSAGFTNVQVDVNPHNFRFRAQRA